MVQICQFSSFSNTHYRNLPLLQSIGLQPFPPKALAVDVEHRSIIENPVKSTEQRILFIEILSPQGRASVAGEDDIISSLLVVPPVDEIEEQPCILLVELTVSDLINNETGRSNETGQH